MLYTAEPKVFYRCSFLGNKLPGENADSFTTREHSECHIKMGRKLHLRAMVCSRNEGGSKRKVGGGATGRAKSKRTKRATEKARAATSTGDDVQAGRDDADFDTAAAFGPEAQHDDVPEGRRGRRRGQGGAISKCVLGFGMMVCDSNGDWRLSRPRPRPQGRRLLASR